MVSDFRKKKYLHVYRSIFDSDHSGSVNQKDFELVADKIAKHRGWKDGDVQYTVVKDTVLEMWKGLQKAADNDSDAEISADEWIALWDKYAQNPDGVSEWQSLCCHFIFQIQDTTMNGSIDANELAYAFESFGLNKEESVDAFKKMSKGKDSVNWAEFQALWKEYFSSDDPEAPGNFIFGNLS